MAATDDQPANLEDDSAEPAVSPDPTRLVRRLGWASIVLGVLVLLANSMPAPGPEHSYRGPWLMIFPGFLVPLNLFLIFFGYGMVEARSWVVHAARGWAVTAILWSVGNVAFDELLRPSESIGERFVVLLLAWCFPGCLLLVFSRPDVRKALGKEI